MFLPLPDFVVLEPYVGPEVRQWALGKSLDILFWAVGLGVTFGWKRIYRAVRRQFGRSSPPPSVVNYRTRRQRRDNHPKLPF